MVQELQNFPWYSWVFAGYSTIIILGLLIYGFTFIRKEIKSH